MKNPSGPRPPTDGPPETAPPGQAPAAGLIPADRQRPWFRHTASPRSRARPWPRSLPRCTSRRSAIPAPLTFHVHCLGFSPVALAGLAAAFRLRLVVAPNLAALLADALLHRRRVLDAGAALGTRPRCRGPWVGSSRPFGVWPPTGGRGPRLSKHNWQSAGR